MYSINIIIDRAVNKNCAVSQKQIYDLYSRKMYSTILRICGSRHDSEDILQDCFIKVFRGLNQYQGKGSFEGWLRKIAIHTTLNYIKTRIRFSEIGDYSNIHNSKIDSASGTVNLQLGYINYILSKISYANRIVFVLYVFEGYSLKEISKILKIKESACRCRYMRAKVALKSMISNQNFEIKKIVETA